MIVAQALAESLGVTRLAAHGVAVLPA